MSEGASERALLDAAFVLALVPALLAALGTGALAGVASLPHCVAMCGPYAAFACTSVRARGGASSPMPSFLVGRALSYGALGAIVGGSGGLVSAALPPRWASLLLAVSLALGMLALAYRLVVVPKPAALAERIVRAAEAEPEGRDKRRLPIAAPRFDRAPAPLFGALMALFPCGTLYAALLIAAGTASPTRGFATLLGFALTSGLGLGLSGWLARAASLLDRNTRRTLGAALAVGAVVLVARPLTAPSPGDAPPVCAKGEAPR